MQKSFKLKRKTWMKTFCSGAQDRSRDDQRLMRMKKIKYKKLKDKGHKTKVFCGMRMVKFRIS
jgi:hypothetical protein